MHAQPPRTLKRLLKQYGQELIDDPRRTEALLRDHCGQHTREIFVLVNAQKQRVPLELRAAPAWMPRQATYSRLSRLLQTKLAITEDAADWAVVSWASALELDSPPKGDNWSWLPGRSRAPSSSSRKPRSKKRQNPASSVQSNKKNARRARERGARAEMTWRLPHLGISTLQQAIRAPLVWANILPWAALVSATLFLLAVVYWTSTTRVLPATLNGDAGSSTIAGESSGSQGQQGATGADNTATGANSIQAIGTPLPELPGAPSEYVNRIFTLPTWANVNVGEGPLLIRQEPSTSAPFLSVLQDGDPVAVIAFSEDSRWSQINSPHLGWVSNDFLLFISADVPYSSIRIHVQLLRARHDAKVLDAPLADAPEVATLLRDDLVVVAAALGQPAEWYQIAEPVVGWVAAADLASTSP